jgi:hypothetical protein
LLPGKEYEFFPGKRNYIGMVCAILDIQKSEFN